MYNVCAGACMPQAHLWRSEDDFVGLLLSFILYKGIKGKLSGLHRKCLTHRAILQAHKVVLWGNLKSVCVYGMLLSLAIVLGPVPTKFSKLRCYLSIPPTSQHHSLLKCGYSHASRGEMLLISPWMAWIRS